jgi:bacterioferritin
MNKKIIQLLNSAVRDELTAIHQYLYFHFHCEDQGLGRLAGLFKKTAIEEMQHVEKLAERILFLEGDVEMRQEKQVEQVKEVRSMLQLSSKMEVDSAKDYNSWAKECTTNNDAISRQLLESLAADEESHYNQFNNEVRNIEKFGDNYLALQSIERSR